MTVRSAVRDHNVQIHCMAPGASYMHITDQILAAGDRPGWREIEEAQAVRPTGGVASRHPDRTRAVFGLRGMQSCRPHALQAPLFSAHPGSQPWRPFSGLYSAMSASFVNLAAHF
jgi:hypothetical protein